MQGHLSSPGSRLRLRHDQIKLDCWYPRQNYRYFHAPTLEHKLGQESQSSLRVPHPQIAHLEIRIPLRLIVGWQSPKPLLHRKTFYRCITAKNRSQCRDHHRAPRTRQEDLKLPDLESKYLDLNNRGRCHQPQIDLILLGGNIDHNCSHQRHLTSFFV